MATEGRADGEAGGGSRGTGKGNGGAGRKGDAVAGEISEEPDRGAGAPAKGSCRAGTRGCRRALQVTKASAQKEETCGEPKALSGLGIAWGGGHVLQRYEDKRKNTVPGPSRLGAPSGCTSPSRGATHLETWIQAPLGQQSQGAVERRGAGGARRHHQGQQQAIELLAAGRAGVWGAREGLSLAQPEQQWNRQLLQPLGRTSMGGASSGQLPTITPREAPRPHRHSRRADGWGRPHTSITTPSTQPGAHGAYPTPCLSLRRG